MEDSGPRPLVSLVLVAASVVVALLLLEGWLRLLERERPPDTPAAAPPAKAPPAAARPAVTTPARNSPADSAAASHTPEYVPSDSLGWTLRPSAVQRFRRDGFDTIVRSNRLGFRGPEVAQKPPGVFRYAVLGDSYAFGWGVEVEETYAAQLETLLAARASARGRYEVVNGALPGFGTYQRLATLERLLPYGLDGVIVEFSVSNDVIDDWRAAPYVPDHMGEYQARGTQFTAIERFLVRRSRLARLAASRSMPLRLWIEGRRPVNLQRTVRLWEALLDRAAILGLPVVVVVNPSRTQVTRGSKLVSWLAHTRYGLRPNAMIWELIEERRLEAVDGEVVFGEATTEDLFLGHDAHWTPAVHRRLAEVLAGALTAARAADGVGGGVSR